MLTTCTHVLTYTYPYTDTCAPTHTHTHTLSLSLLPAHPRPHKFTHVQTLLSDAHSIILSNSPTHPHTHTHTHTLFLPIHFLFLSFSVMHTTWTRAHTPTTHTERERERERETHTLSDQRPDQAPQAHSRPTRPRPGPRKVRPVVDVQGKVGVCECVRGEELGFVNACVRKSWGL